MINRINLLKDTLTCCNAALAKNPNMFPLQLVIDQIGYLLKLEEGRCNDLSKLNSIKIGWITARELDGFPDDQLINKLHLVSAEAEKIKKERSFHD